MQWKKTQFPGVRYREHPERRYNGKPDRYFTVRYKDNGKLREESLGWASEGWCAQKASLQRAELKKAHVTGEGAHTLAEKRRQAEAARAAEKAQQVEEARERLTFGDYFRDTYFPIAQANKRPWTWKRERSLFKLWINPAIGDRALRDVRPIHLEGMKKRMTDAGKSPRSIHYALAVIRQVYNAARRDGILLGECPTAGVSKPHIDNARFRFLTQEEAQELLDALKTNRPQVHEMALFSLHCGLRAGEVFNLCWGHINLENATAIVRHGVKNKRSRIIFLTKALKELLEEKGPGGNDELVFPGENGKPYQQIPATFMKTVNSIGLNDGVTDRRHRVVFHTLRHTYASWLVQNGIDLYTVKQLMGHSTFAMAERYSHLGNDSLQRAVDVLEQSFDELKRDKVIPIADRR